MVSLRVIPTANRSVCGEDSLKPYCSGAAYPIPSVESGRIQVQKDHTVTDGDHDVGGLYIPVDHRRVQGMELFQDLTQADHISADLTDCERAQRGTAAERYFVTERAAGNPAAVDACACPVPTRTRACPNPLPARWNAR